MTITKKCSKCGDVKSLDCFYKQKLGALGVRADCKSCSKVKNLKWRERNPDYKPKRSIEYYIKNKEKIKEKGKLYYAKNREKCLIYGKQNYKKNKDKLNNYSKQYYANNKEKCSKYYKEYRIKNKEKHRIDCRNYYKKDLIKAAHKWMRNFLYRTEQQGFIKNKMNTHTEFGYSPLQLIQRIECQFKEGMNWNNRNLWHIDHKKPICAFIKGTSPKIINMLSNLTPIWKYENLSKGVRY